MFGTEDEGFRFSPCHYQLHQAGYQSSFDHGWSNKAWALTKPCDEHMPGRCDSKGDADAATTSNIVCLLRYPGEDNIDGGAAR